MICRNYSMETGGAGTCPYCHAKNQKSYASCCLPQGFVLAGRYVIRKVTDINDTCITYSARDTKNRNKLTVIREFFPSHYAARTQNGGQGPACVSFFKLDRGVGLYDCPQRSDYQRGYALRSVDPEYNFERRKTEFVAVMRDYNDSDKVADVIEENNTAYLAVEYPGSVTLRGYLRNHKSMSAEEAFTMLEPVIWSLESLHYHGFMHGDVCDQSILVLSDGQLILTDFDPANDRYYGDMPVDENRFYSAEMLQLHGNKVKKSSMVKGPWTDVYALCAVIYLCVTGKMPDSSIERFFEDKLKLPSSLGADIDPVTEFILLYGLAVLPGERCRSAVELVRLYELGRSYFDTVAADRDHPYNRVPALKTLRVVPQISACNYTLGLKKDGTVIATGEDLCGQCGVGSWKDIIAISAGVFCACGVKSDGTVVATEITEEITDRKRDCGQSSVADWKDIVAVSAGLFHTVGLKRDGTAVSTAFTTANYDHGQNKVEDWTDLVAVSAGHIHTVGLKKDGTLAACGSNKWGQCDVGSWKDIIAVSAGRFHTVGLKKDGTCVATEIRNDGDNFGQCNVGGWTDIVAVSAGWFHTVGLKKDGTVVAAGGNGGGQCDVGGWTDTVAIAVGFNHTVGLRKDGTVTATGITDEKYNYGQSNVSGWNLNE